MAGFSRCCLDNLGMRTAFTCADLDAAVRFDLGSACAAACKPWPIGRSAIRLSIPDFADYSAILGWIDASVLAPWRRASVNICDRIDHGRLLLLAAAIVPRRCGATEAAPATRPRSRGLRPPIRPRQATLLGQFGDWGAYTASPGGSKVCFALAKPASIGRPLRPTAAPPPTRSICSSRRARREKVKDEVSVCHRLSAQGQHRSHRRGRRAKFAMYTQNDGAWIKNAAEESQLVDAHAQGPGRGDQGDHRDGHQDHRHVLAQGYRPGARPGRPGVP